MLDTLRAPTNLDVKRYPAVRLSDPARPGRPPPCGTAHNRSRTARTGDDERDLDETGLLEGGVIDEVNLWVHPALGGPGTRPFEGTTLSLELLDVTAYDSGVVLQQYRPRT